MRDAADIALLVCAHYLRIGVAKIIVIDDGSSDGTYERLSRLSRRSHGRIVVRRNLTDVYEQPDLVTQAINELVADGFRFVIPFDADEFWNMRRNELQAEAARTEPRIVVGEWRNFAQTRNRDYPTPFGLFGIRHRAGRGMAALESSVCGFDEPFLHLTEKKIAVWTDAPVSVARGQHSLVVGPTLEAPESYEIFHLPLRFRSELTKRGLNYEPRRSKERTSPAISWQSAFHRRIVLEDRTEAVWAANSADRDGLLDVYGRPAALIEDRRLQKLLLSAAVYLARSCRMLPF